MTLQRCAQTFARTTLAASARRETLTLNYKPCVLDVRLAVLAPCQGRRNAASVSSASKEDPNWWKNAKSIYEFSANDIDGNKLQALHDEFAESRGLRILGFPCNQFASQEPGTNAEIKAFATEKYGVKFDMFAKINVNGDEALPLYKYLKHKQGGFLGSFIKWNFTKFLIDKEGQVVKRYGPKEDPFSIKKDFAKYW